MMKPEIIMCIFCLVLADCHPDMSNKLKIGIKENVADGTHNYSIGIQGTSKTYLIDVGGTLDGWNTAEYAETYDGNYFMQSKFETNQSLEIENMGITDIINPKIVINNRRNYYSVKDILTNIIRPGMSDGEKAQAIYAFWANYETHGHDNNLKPRTSVS